MEAVSSRPFVASIILKGMKRSKGTASVVQRRRLRVCSG